MYEGWSPDEMLSGFNAEIAREVMLRLLERHGVSSVAEHEWTEYLGSLGAHTVRPDMVGRPEPMTVGPLTFTLECQNRRCWLKVSTARSYLDVPDEEFHQSLPMLTWQHVDERPVVFQIC